MCSFDEFKKSAKEFNDSIDTLNIEELDNARKCLGYPISLNGRRNVVEFFGYPL